MKNVNLICIMAVSLTISNVFVANSQEPIVSEECIVKISQFHESVKNKQFAEAYEPWFAVYEACPNANKSIYRDGEKILKALFRATSDEGERRRLAELAIELQDKRIQYFGNDPKYPTAYILGRKGLAYLDFWGSDRIVEAHECLQQSVQQMGEKSEIMVLVKLVDTSYELYKMNPGLYDTEFIADYNLARNYLEMLATNPKNKRADVAQKQIEYVDTIFEKSGVTQ